MNTYQYQVLRFLPDRVSGEFINLGIVVYDPKEKKLAGKFYQKITRASLFFPTINSRYLSSVLKFMQQEFEGICKKMNAELGFDNFDSIEEITKKVLPKDDSALYFTDHKKLLELNIEIATKDLYDQFVLHYIQDEERDYVTDKEVWSKHYKSYFDELKISHHLKNHIVKTKDTELAFEKTWQNGVLNCFEAVSFDLVKEESIKDKTFKWLGRVMELHTTKEALHIYLLTKLPTQHPALKKFVEKKLNGIKFENKLIVELISEDKAEKFAKRIRKEIEVHEAK